MNRRTILTLAGLLLTTACATQQPTQTTKWVPYGNPKLSPAAAVTVCQDDMFEKPEANIDPYYLSQAASPVDPDGNTYGLTLRGHLQFQDCMSRRGYKLIEGSN